MVDGGGARRELTVDTPTQLSGRATFAFMALLTYVWLTQPGSLSGSFRAVGRPGLAVACVYGRRVGGFIIALNHTTVAHVCHPSDLTGAGGAAGVVVCANGSVFAARLRWWSRSPGWG